MIRLLCVAAGVVLMITGCNGLLSLRFGTHRLRSLTLAEAEGGVGDADYIRLTGVGSAHGTWHTDTTAPYPPITLWPLLNEAETQRYRDGATASAHVVAWWEGDGPAALPGVLRGTVERPRAAVPTTFGEGRLLLEQPVTYLHLNESPIAWYWQLALFTGGLLLAIGTEALANQRRAESHPDNP